MNDTPEDCAQQQPCRPPVLPPLSSRTLHHPSFLPLYMAADSHEHRRDRPSQSVPPMIPSEFFYTDPTDPGARRIPNITSGWTVFGHLRLNTPPPIMSACPTQPPQPDPFRSGPHPIRDLGSPTWRREPGQVVLQLSPEEDEAITTLLALHYLIPQSFDCADSFGWGNEEPAWVGPGSDAGSVDLPSCEESSLPTSSSSPPSSLSEVESGPSLLGGRVRILKEWEVTAVHALLSLQDPGALY